jgi:hypothetical protein
MRAVIRYVADNGEARPAVRAIDERIPIAAVRRIKQFAETIVANGDIGRNQRLDGFAAAAGDNAKILIAIAREFDDGNIRDAC